MVSRKNTMILNFAQSQVQLIFHASSKKFKILDIPNVLSLMKSYEHGFVKKYYGHKHYAKSRFDRFFMQCLKNSK
ncbi:hypothetical protein BHE74_00053221 [Ensete ventricosum]|nr:hypothetical protein BHE74_00053221 [Ensete ventricosum]